MKKLLVTLLTALMLLTVCGCTGGNGGKTEPVEPETSAVSRPWYLRDGHRQTSVNILLISTLSSLRVQLMTS